MQLSKIEAALSNEIVYKYLKIQETKSDEIKCENSISLINFDNCKLECLKILEPKKMK